MGVVEEINGIIDLEIIINYDVTAVKLCYTLICNSLLHNCNSLKALTGLDRESAHPLQLHAVK